MATVEKAKRAPGQWRVDFKGLKSRESMLKAVAVEFDFPPHFGVNLDALYDCLTDLPLERGNSYSIELAGLPHGTAGDAIHTVFADAADHWRDSGVAVVVRRD